MELSQQGVSKNSAFALLNKKMGGWSTQNCDQGGADATAAIRQGKTT
jgi:hypothetical protein